MESMLVTRRLSAGQTKLGQAGYGIWKMPVAGGDIHTPPLVQASANQLNWLAHPRRNQARWCQTYWLWFWWHATAARAISMEACVDGICGASAARS